MLVRLCELESQNSALKEQLDNLQQDAGSSGATVASFQSQLAEVQQENDRLIDLLARMDAVRLQLEKDKKQLVGEVVTLRAAAPEADCTDDAQEQINCLQQKLKLEKEKRQQVICKDMSEGLNTSGVFFMI